MRNVLIGKWLSYFLKVLQGNNDGNSSVKHVVYGVFSRYLRFLPQNHQGNKNQVSMEVIRNDACILSDIPLN